MLLSHDPGSSTELEEQQNTQRLPMLVKAIPDARSGLGENGGRKADSGKRQ